MSRTLVAVPAINGGTNDLVLVATTLGTPVLPRDHVLVVSLAPPTGSGTRPSRSASLFTLVLLNPIAITGTATNVSWLSGYCYCLLTLLHRVLRFRRVFSFSKGQQGKRCAIVMAETM